MDEKKYPTCAHCGCVIEMDPDDVRRDPDGEPICDSCFDEHCIICEDCGEVIWRDDAVSISDGWEYVCQDCAEDNYYCCDNCGEWFRSRDMWHTGNVDICENCSEGYFICDDCGDAFPDGEANWYEGEVFCSDCYPDHENEDPDADYIRPYGYKPTIQPRRVPLDDDNCRLYGVELEMDCGTDKPGAVAYDLCAVPEVYCKHDGSLDDGVEVVTHPLSLAYHMTSDVWPEVTRAALAHGFRSHDTTTCGLHVHVGRDTLCYDAPEKLVALTDALWDGLVRFSRRRPAQLNHWAAKPDGGITEYDSAETAKDKANKTAYKGRYQAINLTNARTIEFRLFRGTLKLDTIMATIQLVDALCGYAQTHSVSECTKATFRDVVSSTEHSELKTYSNQRGLY